MKARSILSLSVLIVALIAASGCTPAGSSDGPAVSNDRATPTAAESVGVSATVAPKENPVDTSSKPPAELRAVAEGELTSECRALLARIRSLDEGIPRLFLDLKRSPSDINKDMIDCSAACDAFLKTCPGTSLDCEVRGVFARVLLGRYDRYIQEVQKQYPDTYRELLADYRTKMRAHAESAADCPPSEPARKAEALRVLVEVAKREQDFEKLREKADLLLTSFPDYDLRSHIFFAKGRSFISEGDYEGAAQAMRKVIARHSEDDEYIMYNIVLFEGLSGSGNLEAVEDLMESILVEYPDRIKKIEKSYLRGQYEQWLHVAKFWIGFCRYSLGDIQGARAAFEEHKAEAESLRAELAQKGQKLDPVVEITLEYRTKDLLLFLDQFHGKIPSVDMDFGTYWATEDTLSLNEARGNVVVIVFRRPGDRRSATFLQAAAGLVEEFEDRGIKGAMVGYLLGKPDDAADERKLQVMRAELDQLDVRLPAGYDPDRKKQSFFRATHGTVGTASCVVINRDGELAYFMADPRDMDRQILRRVVTRLLDE